MFLLLYPILLFNTNGKDTKGNIDSYYLHYMGLLEEYLMIQLKEDRALVAIRLAIASELRYYLE